MTPKVGEYISLKFINNTAEYNTLKNATLFDFFDTFNKHILILQSSMIMMLWFYK
jgi:hypothetical protein